MAQKVVVSLVDDIDGGQADETVEFALDGKSYEVDLSSANAAKLRDSVAKYVEAARRPGGGRRAARGTAARSAPVDREQNQAIREWARAQGKRYPTVAGSPPTSSTPTTRANSQSRSSIPGAGCRFAYDDSQSGVSGRTINGCC